MRNDNIKVGSKGTLCQLVKRFGFGFKTTYLDCVMQPLGIDPDTDNILCEVWTTKGSKTPHAFYWGIENPDILEIIED